MLDVLAFGAHPDDVELGAGGSMLAFRNAGLRTGIVDLTRGERGSRGTPETRAAEARRASQMMNLTVRETLEFPDTELAPTMEVRRAVIEAVRRHRPTIVLAPLPGDLHPDHDAAGRAVREAFYPSGMKHAAASGDPFRPHSVYFYTMHDETESAVVMDVSAVWTERLELARCFASQLHSDERDEDCADDFPTLIARGDFFARLEARARVWGRRAGVVHGEPLVPLGALAISDPRVLVAYRPTEYDG